MATTQQDLIARAMPQPIPMPQMPQLSTQQMAMMAQTPMPASMPTPMLRSTPGATGQFADPSSADAYRMLGRTAGYLDPSQAGSYANQQWGQKVERWGQTAGAAASMLPGVGMVTGIGMSLAGGPLFNNPLTRAVFGPSERAAQHMSMMANIQHRTFGNLQLTGGDVGLGGAGMSMPAAMQLGQQFTAKAESWGHVRGAKTEDVNKYKQDLVRMTEMAGQVGLLDASTNIDQISDTVMKLMKVMGRMAKLTGDPDFRNNLQQIGQLRTMGLSIDQAVETTRNLAFYARGAGVSQQQLLQQGGMQGAQAWSQAGLASGVGIGHGAMAQARARQFAGVLDPYTEQIMGGREGIQQKLTGMGAQFAAGPAGQLIMGATMGLNAQGELTTDTGKFQSMMNRGMNMSQLAAESMRNFHRVVEEASQRYHISRIEAKSQLLEKQQALISQMASDPEQLQMMQLGTYGMLRKGGLIMTAAAFEAGGRTMGGATLIKQLASDPTIRDRMRAQLNERLRTLRSEARKERAELREQRDEWRSSQAWDEVPLIGDIRKWRRQRRTALDARRESEAEDLAEEQMKLQDEETGTSSAYVGRTNARLVEEFKRQTERLAKHTGRLIAGAQGLDLYQEARQTLAKGGTAFGGGAWTPGAGPGNQYRMSSDLLGIAQSAAGERDTWAGSAVSWLQRGINSAIDVPLGKFFGGQGESWGKMDKGYVKALDDTFAMASAVKQTEEKSVTDLFKTMNRLESDIVKAGGDPTKVRGAMNAMNSELVTEMERGARSGDKIDPDKLRGIIRDKLIQSKGLTPAQADASLKKYEKEWDQYIVQVGKYLGGPEARVQIAQWQGAGAEADEAQKKQSIEDLNDQIKRSKKKWDEELVRSGVVEGTKIMGVNLGKEGFGRGMTAEEKEAMEGFQGLVAGKGGEKRGAIALLQATMQFGETQEVRDQARAEFSKLRETDEGQKMVADVQKWMSKLGVKGQAFLGKWEKIGTRRGLKMTAKEWEEQIKVGKITQTGILGRMFEPAAKIAEGIEAGATLANGKLTLGGTAAGTKAGAEAKDVESQLAGLDQLAKDFPDATKELKVAAVSLRKAANDMSTKIDKEMEWLRAKLSVD